MTAIQFPLNPVEGTIVNVTTTKKMQFSNGRWKMHTNNIPELTDASYLSTPYVSEEAPALPFAHKLWLKLSTGTLHYQYDAGEGPEWIEIKQAPKEAVVVSGGQIDLSSSDFFITTVSGATTLSVLNVREDGTIQDFILEITNGGSAAITWWDGISWTGGVAPTLTADGRDVLAFYTRDDGSSWTGLVLSLDAKQ